MKGLYRTINHSLVIIITVAFAGGIWLSTLSALPLTLLAPGILSLFFCTLLTLFYRWHTPFFFCLTLLFILLGYGFGCTANRAPHHPHHIYNHIANTKEAVFIGTLHGHPKNLEDESRIIVQSSMIRFPERDVFLPCHGLVQLKTKFSWPQSLVPGDTLIIRSHLNRPSRIQTPGTFDYPHYLATQGIWITGYITSPLHVQQVQQETSLVSHLRYLPERLRGDIARFLDVTLAAELSGLYKALLIGDRSAVSPAHLEIFKRSGCMHILAVSGLHMSIIAAFLFIVIYWLLRRSERLINRVDVKKLAVVLTLLPLCFYTLLAGANIPVTRSLIMVVVVALALVIKRPGTLYITIFFAALVILILMPQSLTTPSFLLSFSAVLAIALILPRLKAVWSPNEEVDQPLSLRQKLVRWLLAGLAISVAATLGTAPLLLYSFNRLSLLGPAANLFAEPLICLWALTLGFISCPLMYIAPPLAAIILQIGSFGLIAALQILTFFVSLPVTELRLATPPAWLICLYYCSLLLILFAAKTSRRLQTMAVLTLLASLILFIVPPSELFAPRKKSPQLTFLDVGQGSCTLIESSSGKRILIDGGGSSSGNFNVGEHVIAPYLWKRGIQHIDEIIVTHPDADHFNGLPFIVKHFSPQKLWVNGTSGHSHHYRIFLEQARQAGTVIAPVHTAQTLFSDDLCTLISLRNPHHHPDTSRPRSTNEDSLIVQFKYHNFTALFPGDIGKFTEHLLVQSGQDVHSTLLLSPHHGSSGSNSQKFLRTVDPHLLIISTGHSAHRKKSITSLLARCETSGITVLDTVTNGTIQLRLHDEGYTIGDFHGEQTTLKQKR